MSDIIYSFLVHQYDLRHGLPPKPQVLVVPGCAGIPWDIPGRALHYCHLKSKAKLYWDVWGFPNGSIVYVYALRLLELTSTY